LNKTFKSQKDDVATLHFDPVPLEIFVYGSFDHSADLFTDPQIDVSS
jgi:hypothetical protein